MQTTEHYLKKLNIGKEVRNFLYKSLLILSLVVTLGVFWELKLTGITMAGEAFCGKDEHAHSVDCLVKELICPLPETEPHTHGPDCQVNVLQCALPEQEAHIHSSACGYENMEYLCGLEADDVHTHSADCGINYTGYRCGLEEADAHVHEDGCFTVSEETFVCGLEETEGHAHGDACYTASGECPLEEHIHVASCYSDVKADLETSAIWCSSLPELEKSPDKANQLVQIARSQLGYQESSRNFLVDENDNRRGITRYGQWYGNPYGDWSAMFVGFCLHYSGLEDLPVNAGAEAMRLEWETAGFYGNVTDFAPSMGNLLFLDKNTNGSADAVAIITGVFGDTIQAIEGDVELSVAETSYTLGDPVLLGYGLIPANLPYQAGEGTTLIAQAEDYSQSLFSNGNCLVVYITDGTDYYAIDGNGDIVQVIIDEDGWVYTDLEIPEMLLWNVTATEDGGYIIENIVTQMYLPESIMPVAAYALDQDGQEPAPNYQYARAVNYTVWLDGTLGGLRSYGNAENRSYTVTGGTVFTLPDTLKSTSEYTYVINGWYDVVNNVYYKPGDKVTVNSNLVFYADWVAATYDIGQFNSQVANTVSTNEFITTHVFDYNVLFNVLSASASTSISPSSHTETWNLITNGNSPYSNEQTLNFIFRDWDDGNQDITYPNNVSNPGPHYPTETGSVYPGLYNSRIGSLLFDPGVEVIGKTYLGTADHLFQLCTDPSDPHYGYHYYDSERNAASYNKSDKRFYVYEYLEQTTDSSGTEGTGKFSDFLPLNSPYANTGGNRLTTYSYSGKYGEYAGTAHYMYDSTNGSASDIATNFFFGMTTSIDFYLPNAPGSGSNQDVYGKDMHFQFSGDDDVWVFIDGKLVLDLGGIHGMESGDINFSSGVVTVNGTPNDLLTSNLRSIGAGEHTLTLYFLERGSSMSNCAIYFNLAPRFSFSIEKEDVLTQEVLNGAQFSVYTDQACTKPAELWVSKASHDRGDTATNVFTVENGVANMWGMGAGHTYYIKETRPPDAEDYDRGISGIICVTIDKSGQASYNVDLLDEGSNGVSSGFTVHGFRIDEQTQKAYIVATNAPKWVTETTGVWAFKKWDDNRNHSGETVTVYLTVTDADGTVRRLQEAQLSSENNWRYRWENLPKYTKDGVTPVQYGVEEAYVSGYFSKVSQTSKFTVTTTTWNTVSTLENGKTYILKTSNGCLSTLDANADTGFQWVSEETAKDSNLALWTVYTGGDYLRLTNGANQSLTFYYNGGSSGYPTDFFASTGGETTESKQYLRPVSANGGIRLFYDGADGRDYYLTANMTNSKKFNYSTTASSGLVFTPITKTVTTESTNVEGWGYEITNTPLDQETSLAVTKHWDYGNAPSSNAHEKAQVTVKLLGNGKDTGRTVTLSLKNNWTDTFRGLPYKDETGKAIVYTVQEVWSSKDWVADYGDITVINGSTPTYSTTITNRYILGISGPLLPSTGSRARQNYMLCGGAIMLASLVYGIGTRRKRERRME